MQFRLQLKNICNYNLNSTISVTAAQEYLQMHIENLENTQKYTIHSKYLQYPQKYFTIYH